MDPEPRLRVPNEPTLPTIPPVNFAHTQSPSITVVEHPTPTVPPGHIEPQDTRRLVASTTSRIHTPDARTYVEKPFINDVNSAPDVTDSILTPEAATVPAAKKATSTIDPHLPSQQTTRPPRDLHSQLRQASTAALPSKVSATSDSQSTKNLRIPAAPTQRVHTDCRGILLADLRRHDSGFWGWKSDDRDTWDDTGQSSSDVSMVSGCISCILAPPEVAPGYYQLGNEFVEIEFRRVARVHENSRSDNCRNGRGYLVAADMGRLVYSPILRRLGARSVYSSAPSLPPGLPSRLDPLVVSTLPQANLPPRSTSIELTPRPRLGDEGSGVENCAETGCEDDASSEIDADSPTPPRLWCVGLFVSSYPTGSGREQFISVIEQQNGSSLDCGRGRSCICCFSHRSAPLFTASAGSASITRYAISENKTVAHTVTSSSATNSTVWKVRVLEHNRLQLGPGFVVEKLMTGFETPFVLLEGIPSNVSTALLTKTLSDHGRVMDIRHAGVQGRNYRVKFGSPKEAQDVISELNGSILFDRKISARLFYLSNRTINGVFTDTVVFVKWEVPGKIAYGGYDSKIRATRAISPR
ncbi:ring finger protein [Salix suchowensis]|nr:ring finger protein [Salix suchowensis]